MPWSDDVIAGTPAYAIAASINPRIRVVAGPGTGKSFAMKRRVLCRIREWSAMLILLTEFGWRAPGVRQSLPGSCHPAFKSL